MLKCKIIATLAVFAVVALAAVGSASAANFNCESSAASKAVFGLHVVTDEDINANVSCALGTLVSIWAVEHPRPSIYARPWTLYKGRRLYIGQWRFSWHNFGGAARTFTVRPVLGSEYAGRVFSIEFGVRLS